MAKTADYKLGQFTYPRGWMMVAASSAIKSVPVEGRFFGEDVVLYRGASGQVIMLDAYCPHMGAHLAVGASGATAQHCVQVVGDSIRCPNHGWRFGADGRCEDIPYSDMIIPETLRIKSWQTQEYAGCVFAWHDEEGGEPCYDLPDIPQLQDPQWMTGPVIDMGIWNVHPLELAEHGVDKMHLANVHGADKVVYHRVTFNDHKAETTSHTAMATADDEAVVVNVAHSRYTGPAFLISEMEGPQPVIYIFCHTPVDDGCVHTWHTMMMKIKGDEICEEDTESYQQVAEISRLAFEQDLHIFARKRPALRVAQISGDPPFRQYRHWYSQFYQPRAQIESIQEKANAVIETDGVHLAPWIASH